MHFWETNDSNKLRFSGQQQVATVLPDALWVPLSMSSLKSWVSKAVTGSRICRIYGNWSFATTNNTLPRYVKRQVYVPTQSGNNLRVGICFCFVLFFLFIYCWLLTMEILHDANPKRKEYIYIYICFFSIFISNETWNASRGISG